MRYVTLALAVSVVLVVQACALNPVSKRPEPVILSTGMEESLGAEMHKTLMAAVGLVPDPELQSYVRSIGQRLAVHSPRRDVTYRFFVVDMPDTNAFAAPGGYIYVTRGLLASSNSEDELANVLGHEIAHVASRHANQRAVRQVPLAIVFGIPAAITGWIIRPVGNAIGAVGQFTSGIFISPYSRSQEAGADKLGQELATQAGYDPGGMSQFMATMGRLVEKFGGNPRRTAFFDTHPNPEGRFRKTRKRAEKLEPKRAPYDPVAPDHAAFLGKLDGLLVGLSGAEGAFVDNRFLQAILEFRIDFPKDWQTQNASMAVAAISDGDEAMIVLSLMAEGDDPAVAGQGIAKDNKIKLDRAPERLRINGIPAARARGSTGRGGNRVQLDLTWIAHRGLVYQIVGATRPAHFTTYQASFEGTAKSFHRLGEKDRKKVTESRLRVAQARSGENLTLLVERKQGTWSPEMTAIANALQAEEPLQAAQLVKVPRAEPFKYVAPVGVKR